MNNMCYFRSHVGSSLVGLIKKIRCSLKFCRLKRSFATMFSAEMMSTQSPPKSPVPTEVERSVRRRTRSPVPTERDDVPDARTDDDPRVDDGRFNEIRYFAETITYNEQFAASQRQQMELFQAMQKSMRWAHLANAAKQRQLEATEEQLKTTCKQLVNTERKLQLTHESYRHYKALQDERCNQIDGADQMPKDESGDASDD